MAARTFRAATRPTRHRDRAFVHLDRAIAKNATQATFLNIDPRLDELAKDPRFASRLAKMKLVRPAK